MSRDLTFDELSRLTGASVISCDDDGNYLGEYVVEEFDEEHGLISVSSKEKMNVISIWPEQLYIWHFRFPDVSVRTSEKKRCPLKFGNCSRLCAWFDEDTGLCAVFRRIRVGD